MGARSRYGPSLSPTKSGISLNQFSLADQKAELVCAAIYTRKSTVEGLDHEFDSLDAQREAAEALTTRRLDRAALGTVHASTGSVVNMHAGTLESHTASHGCVIA
jgi:hypothetical protein